MKTGKVFEKIKIVLLLTILLLPVFNLNSQDIIDLDLLSAREEFKWGVKAYHRGLFNEAARAFEKALAYKPENTEMQEWLGQAWYRSGFTDAAMRIWESIRSIGEADSLLMNRLEILRQQTGVNAEGQGGGRYLPAMELKGVQEDFTLFRRPASVFPDADGGFFVTSYGSNQVLAFNSNGALTNRLVGGLEGFNHPFDLKLAGNGYLYVTEFNGDSITRCTPDGRELTVFGESGRGEGQLLGPQYLAVDEKNFIYVTDSGNRRVVKFDSEGNYILSFGEKSYNFRGFKNPTGIECFDGRVYVADAKYANISVFDYSGNYLAELTADGLYSPEGLSRLGRRSLLIADAGRVMSIDVDNADLRLVSDLDGKGKKITQASIDANGNLLTADFDMNRITVLTELSNMYSGLSLQIDRIEASDYPTVAANIRVSDRSGKPFVGLSPNNFVITENGYPVKSPELVYRGNTSDRLEAVVVLDCDISMKEYHPDMLKAVQSLMNSAGSRAGLKLVSAGINPVTEANLAEGSRQFIAAASDESIFSAEAQFDLGLRHAASELVNQHGRRTVIFITDGRSGNLSFDHYHPVELAGYLRNNGISFYCVDVSNENGISEELSFICEETGGDNLYLYQPEGLGRMFDEITLKPDGSYTLVFDSINRNLSPDDFIPVEIEAFLYNRSGREVSGYFKPGN